MIGVRDFVCVDCGVEAIFVAADDSADPTPLRCGPCQWKHETPDLDARERIKGLTHRRDVSDR